MVQIMSNTKSFLWGCRGSTLRALMIGLIMCPSYVLYGYSSASIGNLLTIHNWTAVFPQIDTVHVTGSTKSQHSTLQGAVVAMFTIGGLFGALACAPLGDIFGRRKVIFASALISLVGQILEVTAFGLPQFIVGRLLLGFGVGGSSATVPVWQSECSPAKYRGSNVCLVGTFISLGYTITSWASFGLLRVDNSAVQWRAVLAIPSLFCIPILGFIFLLPESPRWLIRVGRREEAIICLAKLKDLEIDAPELLSEIYGIEQSLEETQSGASAFKDLFKLGDEKLLFRLGICCLLQFFQEMSGSTVVAIYGNTIFQNLKLDVRTSKILTASTLTWKMLSGLVSFFTVDRVGRRPLFMISGAGVCSSMVALAVATSMPSTNHSASIASVFFIFLFNFFVPIGFLGVNYLYCTEIAPIRLRVPMVAISTANHWLWNFTITMVTPVAFDQIGPRYWIVFVVVSSLIPISVFFLFPETVGRNLEEIDLAFRESKSIFSVVSNARRISKREAGALSFEKEEEQRIEKL
ncbi:general substrate transporter [Xylogone sp. PMI_703]|nr:general substrate transporter [Xylogone sp. PMI_703]